MKSKVNLSTEVIRSALKTNNPTAIKIGIKSFKSLKDSRVLIEAGNPAEITLLSTSIRDKCGEELEVTVPKLRKPRIILQDVTIENLQEIILVQNPELSLVSGDIEARFTCRSKWGLVKMVIEFGSETRNKLLHKELKKGWLICNVDDYLVAKRCFKYSRFNHRHHDCRGVEKCPLCAGGHKLKECRSPSEQYKCINCMTYNWYSKADKVSENHSSLDKNCPSMQAVLAKYRLNTDN